MKSKFQQLLEETYEQLYTPRSKYFILGQDEKGPYKVSMSSDGKPLKNRFYHFYDAEGNFLSPETSLEAGQIMNRTDEPGIFFKVTPQENQFVAVPFTPEREIRDRIKQQVTSRVNKGREQAMAHFFPKN